MREKRHARPASADAAGHWYLESGSVCVFSMKFHAGLLILPEKRGKIASMRVLIIEDNERLAQSLQDILKQIWYDADICTDGISGACQMETGAYDAVILDLMLPGKDGFSVLAEARSKGIQTPVLLLTARSEVEDKVRGLDAGADYYLTKPFEAEELLAVMKTLVRRQGELIPDAVTVGDLTLDRKNYTLSGPEKQIQLGRKEYDIMRILMANRGLVISKETLLLKVWGEGSDAVENNVETYISFLRKKLLFLKVHVWIVTIRGLGYRLTEKEDGA